MFSRWVGVCLGKSWRCGMFDVSVESAASVFRIEMGMNICGYMVKACGVSGPSPSTHFTFHFWLTYRPFQRTVCHISLSTVILRPHLALNSLPVLWVSLKICLHKFDYFPIGHLVQCHQRERLKTQWRWCPTHWLNSGREPQEGFSTKTLTLTVKLGAARDSQRLATHSVQNGTSRRIIISSFHSHVLPVCKWAWTDGTEF